MKLKTRFKIAIIIMILSVAIMNMAIVSFYISNSLKKNSEQAMHSINKQKMITIENLLDSFVTMTQKPLIDESMMDILVKEYEEKPNTSVRYQMYEDIDLMGERLYSEMYYRNEYIYGVTIFAANDGRTYYKQRSGKRYLEKDPESLEWYQELLKTDGKEAVLFPYMKEDLYLGEEPIIAIGRLLKNPMTNQIAGVIRIDIAVKDLGKIWEDDEMGGTTKVVFFDKNKELLYTSFPAENWKKEYEKQRKKHLEVMTASERYGVFIATLLTRNQMYEEAYKVIFTIVVITLGGILFSLFWVEFILNKSMQPIGELNRLMKEVREGDLSVRAKVGTDGEFEEVCESFNLMVENTEHLIERVRLEESEKMEAEYRALQAQISPHFILNTLNTIRWMAVIQGNKAIDKALDSFSRLLAFVVRRREDTIPIREELEQMNYYIDILSLRYYNKFQIEMDVEEEVKSCLTVKFLLQTLVENSVFHGFDEMSGKGEIKVKVCRRSDSIVYEVQDNGKGICEERIEEILKKERKEQKGMVKIGLYNINRRIKLVFGEEYGISIRSVPGEYTVVSVVIPAQEEKNVEDSDC